MEAGTHGPARSRRAGDNAPLSFGHQRAWMQRMAPHSPAYGNPVTLRISGGCGARRKVGGHATVDSRRSASSPFGVSGSASRKTKADGTMYSGRPHVLQRAADRRDTPRALDSLLALRQIHTAPGQAASAGVPLAGMAQPPI